MEPSHGNVVLNHMQSARASWACAYAWTYQSPRRSQILGLDVDSDKLKKNTADLTGYKTTASICISLCGKKHYVVDRLAIITQDEHNVLSLKLWIFSNPSIQIYVLGAQKNRLSETVLLSTHNICFGREIKKYLRTLIYWAWAHH